MLENMRFDKFRSGRLLEMTLSQMTGVLTEEKFLFIHSFGHLLGIFHKRLHEPVINRSRFELELCLKRYSYGKNCFPAMHRVSMPRL